MGYPAPIRQMWSTMIEFRDGQQVVGTDDADAIDAWRRIHWVSSAKDRPDFKQMILVHARGAYNAVLIGLTGDTPDGPFLDALAAEGCLTVIRK